MRIEEISGNDLNDRQRQKDRLIRSNSFEDDWPNSIDGDQPSSPSEEYSNHRAIQQPSNGVDDLPQLHFSQSDLRNHQELRLDRSSFDSQHISLNFEADRQGSHRSFAESEKRSFYSFQSVPGENKQRQRIDEP